MKERNILTIKIIQETEWEKYVSGLLHISTNNHQTIIEWMQ